MLVYSDCHVEAEYKLFLIKQNVNVSYQLQDCITKEQASAHIASHAICTTLLTLAQIGCTIRGHEDNSGNIIAWLETQAQDISQLKSKFLYAFDRPT